VTRYPRVDPAGNLVPEVADLLLGMQEVARLRAQGAEVDEDLADVQELGRSISDHHPVTADDPHMAEVLAQVQARNRRVREELARGQGRAHPAPDGLNRMAPKVDEYPLGRDRAHGQDDHAGRAHPQTHDRNEEKDPIKEYLRTVPDPPDEDWS
jgi:hypothetical protein